MDNSQKTNPKPSKIAVAATQDGIERCRFDLFLRLYPNAASPFPKNARVWTYRGDKFTDVEEHMLCNLVRHIIRKRNLYAVIELYDNSYARNDARRIVLKMTDQLPDPENNRLPNYHEMLKNIAIPEFLK